MSSPKIKLTPYYRELLGDLDTPVSAYIKLNKPESFLLESVTGGEQVARYSFIGFDPFCSYISKADDLHPVDQLQSLLNQYEIDPLPEIPALAGGAVGFFSWEVLQTFEPIVFRDKPDTAIPMAHFIFPRSLVIFDHAQRKLLLLTLSEDHDVSAATARLDAIEAALQTPLPKSLMKMPEPSATCLAQVESNHSKESFQAGVLKAKSFIYEGDAFQLVLSQKFRLPQKKQSFEVYRHLRLINPSPYMFYFNFPQYQLMGSSPEMLVKLTDRKAVLRPIAGTRPRVRGQETVMIEDLKADKKEVAEHVMLVDLGRNDLGRVCDFHSVKVTELMGIETYSHVIHMVSHIEGQLKSGKTAFDLFKATFPAGTLSGTPKLRAIEIIDELEPEKRGFYGGALGYFDLRGNMDLCIIIRTILSQNNTLTVQAGAGLVADSDPETEYEESCNKAKGMIQACC